MKIFRILELASVIVAQSPNSDGDVSRTHTSAHKALQKHSGHTDAKIDSLLGIEIDLDFYQTACLMLNP